MNRIHIHAIKIILMLTLAASNNPAHASEILAKVPGFLVPTEATIPHSYRCFIHTVKNDIYYFQFDRWQDADPSNTKPVVLGNGVVGFQGFAEHGRMRDAQLFFSEARDDDSNNYESLKQFYETDKSSKKVKEFTLNGCNGVIFESSNFSQKERVTYYLLFKDENKLLKITNVFEKKDPNFTSDSLIEMLQKFKRVK